MISPSSSKTLMYCLSSLCQLITGSGYPSAVHSSVTLAPKTVSKSFVVRSILMSGGMKTSSEAVWNKHQILTRPIKIQGPFYLLHYRCCIYLAHVESTVFRQYPLYYQVKDRYKITSDLICYVTLQSSIKAIMHNNYKYFYLNAWIWSDDCVVNGLDGFCVSFHPSNLKNRPKFMLWKYDVQDKYAFTWFYYLVYIGYSIVILAQAMIT